MTERYHVIRRLAVGGMGEIFLARQAIAGVHRLVVLKRLLPELAEDPQQLAMFVDEARIAANLSHPNIVQVHEFGEDEEGHFIVMEYVPGMHVGRLLTRALRDQRPLEPRIGAFIVHEVARALDHAHRARDAGGNPLDIVHRDISPQNVMVSFAGDVKLMDFGIASAAIRARRTNDGTIRGKFPYMSPEQIESKQLDARSDVFAMGIVLWEITLNHRLFAGESDYDVIRAVLDSPIPRPRSIDPSYPSALEDVVMSSLERDRDHRLASAGELASGLKAFLKDQPVDREDLAATLALLFPEDAAEVATLQEHTRALPTPPTGVIVVVDGAGEPAPRRRRWPIAVAGVLSLATAGTIATHGWRQSSRDAPVDGARAALADPGDAGIGRDADLAPDAGAESDADTGSDAGPATAIIDDTRAHVVVPARIVRDAGHDASPAIVAARLPDAGVTTGQLRFVFEDEKDNGTNVEIAIDGHKPTRELCTSPTIQARCTLPIGAHQVDFQVSSTGLAFGRTLQVGPNVAKCKVALVRKEVSCEPL
ncbi:MAG: serine/threonine-protein kinase [Deltaproteobacteria bacterium]